MAQHSFRKAEKLCEKKLMDQLFMEGESMLVFPFKVLYKVVNESNNTQGSGSGAVLRVGIAVSKKRHRKAVGRNRIKRLIREAFRLNKTAINHFLKEQNIQLIAMFIYVANHELAFYSIDIKMKKALEELIKVHQKEVA